MIYYYYRNKIWLKDFGMLKNENVSCEGCALGKMHRDEFPSNPNKIKRDVLDIVHSDVC